MTRITTVGTRIRSNRSRMANGTRLEKDVSARWIRGYVVVEYQNSTHDAGIGQNASATAVNIANSSTVNRLIQIRCAPLPNTRAIVAGGHSHREATLLLTAEDQARFRWKLPRSHTVGRLPMTLGFTWTVYFFPTILTRRNSSPAFGAASCRGSRLPIRLRPATNATSSHRSDLVAVASISTVTWS